MYFCFSQNKLWQRRLNLLRHQRAQHLHFLTNLQNCKTSKCQESSNTCLIAMLCSKQLQNFIIHNIGCNKAHLLWSVLVQQFLGQLALLESTDIDEQVLFDNDVDEEGKDGYLKLTSSPTCWYRDISRYRFTGRTNLPNWDCPVCKMQRRKRLDRN